MMLSLVMIKYDTLPEKVLKENNEISDKSW